MIEVGEYVRLARNQGINKIVHIKDDDYYFLDDEIADKYGEIIDFIRKDKLQEEIIKHSFNIIDLIEEGDFVNGYKVEKIKDGYVYVDYCWDCNLYTLVTNEPDNIKTILTKEQYEANCYKVKEE